MVNDYFIVVPKDWDAERLALALNRVSLRDKGVPLLFKTGVEALQSSRSHGVDMDRTKLALLEITMEKGR